jgi:hypothetical protein
MFAGGSWRRVTRVYAAMIGIGMVGAASPTLAAAPVYSVRTSYCDTADNFCVYDEAQNKPDPQRVGIGNYAGAQTYSAKGGLATASVHFAPLVPTQQRPGIYSAGATSDIFYTFQVKGAPDTFVPVNVIGNIIAGRIAATDINGHNYELEDDPNFPGDNDAIVTESNYQISSAAILTILQTSSRGGRIGVDRLEASNAFFGDRDKARDAEGIGKTINQTFYFLSNTDIVVSLSAQATLRYATTYPAIPNQYGSVTASADPVFTITDPNFSEFQVVGVPDGPGPAAVPEPAAWATMIAGLGMIGLCARRRRQVTAVSPRLVA